jgi:transposase
VKSDGRRVYERDAKLAIVREAIQPGVSLAGVALRHGINANLLRKWVVKHRAQGEAETPTLLPVVMTPSLVPTTRSSQAKLRRERTAIEVECVRGVAKFDDGIDRAVLRELIEAMSAR